MDFSAAQKRIRELLKERRAILLAHYYQTPEVQDTADFLGDSLALSLEAARTDAEVIVFAGVHFMAESAFIVNPERTVLLPKENAGCALADMITAVELRKFKQDNPDVKVVSYVNSSAAVKALSDICCTSANAAKVVNAVEGDRVLFVPDHNLGLYTAKFTKKEVIPWKGHCPVHHLVTAEEVMAVKTRHPGAPFAAHPECRQEVLDLAEFVGSTTAILKFARDISAREVIIGTEEGILHQLKKARPEKTFIMASNKMICKTMKVITLDDIINSLERIEHVIMVPEEIRAPASLALKRMLEIK